MKLIDKIKQKIRRHLRSYRAALSGLRIAFTSELNFQIELILALSIIFIGFFFNISIYEWIVVIFCIGITLFAELINTSVETLGELRAFNHVVRKIKDLAAASVLVIAFMDIVLALIIFLPYVKDYWVLIFTYL
jgi:diacylglycerol kinase